MVPLASLWLPILLAAVLVFAASSIIHMVLPYHRNDFRPVPDEDRLMADLRRSALAPGEYAVPRAASAKAMSDPAFQAKLAEGPSALIAILPPGGPQMGKTLGLWFAYTLVVSAFAGYVASRAAGPFADYLEVFRFAGSAAFAAYVLGPWQQSIWYGRPWSTTLKSTFDGIVYALLTGGVFGWLWG
jgi:hypothetical protein